MPEPSRWQLHPQLLKDSFPIIDLSLSNIRLLDDGRFPWVLIIPRLPAIASWFDLDWDAQRMVMAEIDQVGQVLDQLYQPTRINVGMIGNRVDQLHVHCIARHEGDPAWPDVVWGHGQRLPYAPLDRLDRCSRISAGLSAISAPD